MKIKLGRYLLDNCVGCTPPYSSERANVRRESSGYQRGSQGEGIETGSLFICILIFVFLAVFSSWLAFSKSSETKLGVE